MSLKLKYRGQTTLPVEVEGFTPDWAWDKSIAEIEQFEIFHGNIRLPLAEMFSVEGDAGDKRFEFEGDLRGVHWIGAGMRSGEIHVAGAVGRHVGSELRGGEIHVYGNTLGWAGCEMRDGLIHIRGSAGDVLGGAYRGSAQGMRGGTIIVDGNSGNETGLLMKQGMIAVAGDTGEMPGYGMTGGTILIGGACRGRAGAEMHAGTIAILGTRPTAMLSSFRIARELQPADRIGSLLQELRTQGWAPGEQGSPAGLMGYVGDLVVGGQGELFIRGISR